MSQSAGVERSRSLLGENAEKIDAEAHIAGFDDTRMPRRRLEPGFVARRAAGGTDDVNDAGLRREMRQIRRRPPAT